MITPQRQAQLARAAEDHAARYAHPHNPVVNDPARYSAEHAKATGWEWEWIAEYLRHHPEILQRPPLTLAQLDERDRREAEQRRARVAQLASQAREAYDQGDKVRALDLVDQGEQLDPTGRPWAKIRDVITGGRPLTYYVCVRSGSQTGYPVGPFPSREAANPWVEPTREWSRANVDGWSWGYEWGVALVVTGGPPAPGRWNAGVGYSPPA